jgi:hypothetical protein
LFFTKERLMNFKKTLPAMGAALILSATGMVASAQTARIANQGDALSMDPHSLNESLQLSVTGNVYEPLVGRGKDLALARHWPRPGSKPRPPCGGLNCAKASLSMTGRRLPRTMWCSRWRGLPVRGPT